jgi:hypothetical protein
VELHDFLQISLDSLLGHCQLVPQRNDRALFLGESLIFLDAIDPNETFTQDSFANSALSDLSKHTQNLCRREQTVTLSAPMSIALLQWTESHSQKESQTHNIS